jgi:hypothetical protein
MSTQYIVQVRNKLAAVYFIIMLSLLGGQNFAINNTSADYNTETFFAKNKLPTSSLGSVIACSTKPGGVSRYSAIARSAASRLFNATKPLVVKGWTLFRQRLQKGRFFHFLLICLSLAILSCLSFFYNYLPQDTLFISLTLERDLIRKVFPLAL